MKRIFHKQMKRIFHKAYRSKDIAGIGRVIIYTIPAIPCFVVLLATRSPIIILLGVAILFLLSIQVALFRLRMNSLVRKCVSRIIITLAWIPAIFVVSILREIFPWAIVIFPVAVLFGLFSYATLTHISRIMLGTFTPLITAVVIVFGFHDLEVFLGAGFLLGLLALGIFSVLIEFSWNRPLARTIYIPFTSTLVVYGFLSLNVYVNRTSNDPATILATAGIVRVDGDVYSPPPKNDINFFLFNNDNVYTTFDHSPPNSHILSYIDSKVKTEIDLKGLITDESVLNRNLGVYYFIGNKILYEYGIQNCRLRPIASLEEAYDQLRPFQATGNIREYPRERARRLLIQFDNAHGIITYDLDNGNLSLLPMPIRITDSIWAADGTRIISLAFKENRLCPPKGKLFLLDTSGHVLRERILDSPLAYLTQTDRSFFFIGYYFSNKVDKVSCETLETISCVQTDPIPRAMYFLSHLNLLMVPSFAAGTLTLVDTDLMVVVRKVLIGRRVRAIIPSHEMGLYTISSTAGLFTVNPASLIADPDQGGKGRDAAGRNDL